jgi:hypothetical protein
MTEQRKTVGAAVTYIPQQIIVRERIQMFVNRRWCKVPSRSFTAKKRCVTFSNCGIESPWRNQIC